METQFERELEKVMNETLRPPQPQPVPPRPVKLTNQSLTEQFDTMEKVRRELKQRLMDRKLNLENEYQTRRHEIIHQYERDLQEAQLELEMKRDAALRQLVEEMKASLREVESLSSRLAG